jgi:hypothetical protein
MLAAVPEGRGYRFQVIQETVFLEEQAAGWAVTDQGAG